MATGKSTNEWARRGLADALVPPAREAACPADVGVVVDLNLSCAVVSPYSGKLGIDLVRESVHLLISALQRAHQDDDIVELGTLAVTVVMTVGSAPLATVVLPAGAHQWDSVIQQVEAGMTAATNEFIQRVRRYRAAARQETFIGNHFRTDLSDLVAVGLLTRSPKVSPGKHFHLVIISDDGAGSNEVAAELLVASLLAKKVRVSALVGPGTGSLNSIREYDAISLVSRVTQGVVANAATVESIIDTLTQPATGVTPSSNRLPWASLRVECQLHPIPEKQRLVYDTADELLIAKKTASLVDHQAIAGGNLYPFSGKPINVLVRRGIIRKFSVACNSIRLVLASLGRDGFRLGDIEIVRTSGDQVQVTVDIVRLWRSHLRIFQKLKFTATDGNVWSTPMELAHVEIGVIAEPSVFHFLIRAEANAFVGLSEQTRMKMRSLLQKINEVENVNRFVSALGNSDAAHSEVGLARAFMSNQLQPSRWHRIFRISSFDVMHKSDIDSICCLRDALGSLSCSRIRIGGTSLTIVWIAKGFILVEFSLVAAQVGRFILHSFSATEVESDYIEHQMCTSLRESPCCPKVIPTWVSADLYSLPHAELPRMTVRSSPQPSVALQLGNTLFFRKQALRRGLPTRPVLAAMHESRNCAGFLELDSFDLSKVDVGSVFECRYLKILEQGALFYSLRLEDNANIVCETRLQPPGCAVLERARRLVEAEDEAISGLAALTHNPPDARNYPVKQQWMHDPIWPVTQISFTYQNMEQSGSHLVEEMEKILIDSPGARKLPDGAGHLLDFDGLWLVSIICTKSTIELECRYIKMPSAWLSEEWRLSNDGSQESRRTPSQICRALPKPLRNQLNHAYDLARLEVVKSAIYASGPVQMMELSWALEYASSPVQISLGRVPPSSAISGPMCKRILNSLQTSTHVHQLEFSQPSRYFFIPAQNIENYPVDILEYNLKSSPFTFIRHCLTIPSESTSNDWLERSVQVATELVEDASTLSAGRKVLSLVSSELNLPRIVLDRILSRARELSIDEVPGCDRPRCSLMKVLQQKNRPNTPELVIKQFSELNGNFSMYMEGPNVGLIRENTLDAELSFPVVTLFRESDRIAYDCQLEACIEFLHNESTELGAIAQLMTLAERFPRDAPLQARGLLVAKEFSAWKRIGRHQFDLLGKADRGKVSVRNILQALEQEVSTTSISFRVSEVDQGGLPIACLLRGPMRVEPVSSAFFAATIRWTGSYWKSLAVRVVVGGFTSGQVSDMSAPSSVNEIRREMLSHGTGQILDLFENTLGVVLSHSSTAVY